MIVSLGEILIDYTPKGKSEAGMDLFEQNAGGAPANVLACCAKLGDETAFIGKIGDDMQGNFLKQTLQNANIKTNGLVVDKRYFTTLAFVSLTETGERTFAFARKPGADTQLEQDELNVEILKQANIFHFGSLSLTHEPAKTTTYKAIQIAKDNGAIISYDPNYRKPLWTSEELAKEQMRKPLSLVDIIKLSDEECELLTGEQEIESACKKLMKDGIKIVVITLGANGAMIGFDGKYKVVSGFKPNKVVDTTGAGDSFWGGFLHKINQQGLQNISIEILYEYTCFANAVASLCVENFGAIKAMPTLEQINDRLLKK